MSSTSIPAGHHLAAILQSKDSHGTLTLHNRETPSPGPGGILIDVKSIALNPIDNYQRDRGILPINYPAVLGSDIAGKIISVGSEVKNSTFRPGTRVAAFAPCFFTKGAPDYGAFQTKVLVPAINVCPLPENLSYNQGALLPMAVLTAWSGWYTIGVSRNTCFNAADKKGMLVWGAASSVGSTTVQIARMMGYTVYATASRKDHEYLRGLGVARLFDYADHDVVEQIISTARSDGVTVQTGYDAVGAVEPCLQILKRLRGKEETVARLAAAATHVTETSPKVDGVQWEFVSAPKDQEERDRHFEFIFNVWLKEKLERNEFFPSPIIQVVGGGLKAVNEALDILKNGVSLTKIVLEV